MWVGTSDGLIRMRNNEQRLFEIKGGLADNFVLSLAKGSGGTIWIGTRNGFSRVRDGILDSFRPQDGLSQSTAVAVFEDREETLWVGTKRGLNQFVDGRGVPYTVSEDCPAMRRARARRSNRRGLGRHLDRGLARFDRTAFHGLTRAMAWPRIPSTPDRGPRWLAVGWHAERSKPAARRALVETYNVQRACRQT
jgi:hypothetical protein